MITVVLADDQPLVLAGLRMLLEAEADIEVVGEASNGADALACVAEHAPQVVLMDLRMPGMDGAEATRRIVAERGASETPTRVLVLTTFNDDDALYGALRAGASGFMLKHASATEVADAVRRVAQGDVWLDPAVAGRVLENLRPPTPAAEIEAIALLTPREREVLTLVAQGMSNDEIKRTLWLSEATVKTHVARILMKTGSRDRAAAVALAYRSGFVRVE